MSNPYFEHETRLVPFSQARAEDVNDLFDAVTIGFDRAFDDVASVVAGGLPSLAGNANKALVVNGASDAAIWRTVTPEFVGAATAGHTHTPEFLGVSPADHTHTPEFIGAAPAAHTHVAADLPVASTSAAGVVMLNNSTESTSTTTAATASAVNAVRGLIPTNPAGYTTSSSSSETNFPLGSLLVAYSAAAVTRGASATIRLDINDSTVFIANSAFSTPLVSGTWRSRGAIGFTASASGGSPSLLRTLFQRVA
jgi:hypothetical protein